MLNFYCITVAVCTKKLRSLDFYLVQLQSLYDCVFVGFMGFILKWLQFAERIEDVCEFAKSKKSGV